MNYKKNLTFKCSVIKSFPLCISKLLKKEFKLNPIFSRSQLIKYRYILSLNRLFDSKFDLDKAFFIASNDSSLDKLRYLLEACAKINVYYSMESFNKSPLLNATENKNFEILKFLVENGACLNAKGDFDRTPLAIACQHSDLRMIKCLIENGADINVHS